MNTKSFLVKIGADDSELQSKLGQSVQALQKAGRAMTVVGAAVVGSVGLMVKGYVEAGDEVQKMAKRTGFSTTALSELRYAANICGTSLGSIEKGVKRMSGTILDANDGMETYVRAFDHMGIEVKDLMGLKPEEQFYKISEAIAEIEDPTMRAALAQDVFGRAGTELLPLFAEGKRGLADLREEAHRLGIVFDQEAADKAAKLKDAQTELKESFKGVGNTIAATLIPAITNIVEKISGVIVKVREWMEKHPELASLITKVTLVIGGLCAVLGPLLMMLPGLAIAFSALTGPIGLVVTGLGLITIKALEAKKAFKESMDLFQKESEITGKKVGWLEKTLASIDTAWAKVARGIDFNRIALNAYNEEQRKAQGVLTIVTGVSKVLSGGVKFLGEKWQELVGSLSKVEEGTKKVIEKFKVITEIIETEIHPALRKMGEITQEVVIASMFNIGKLEERIVNLSNIFPEELEPSALNSFEIIKNAMGELRTRIYDDGEEIKRHWTQTFNDISECVYTAIGGMDAAFAQAYTNAMIRIDNEEKRRLEAIDNMYNATIAANEALVEAEKAKTEEVFQIINDEYDKKKQRIINNVKDETKRAEMLADLEEAREEALEQARIEREKAEQDTADALEKIEEEKNEALRLASEELEIKRSEARRTAAKQEKAVALMSAIVNTATGVTKALSSGIPPWNIILAAITAAAGAAQIALINAQPIPLKEGGLVTSRTIAEIGEAGPELVIPLNKLQPAFAGMAGGFKQYNYFYGNINNAGDVDEISNRLAEKVRRKIEQGRS